jgi:hypothetical protein
MEVKFGQHFTHDSSKGRDHTQPISVVPEPVVVSIPAEGITDNELLVEQRKEQNRQNAWMLVAERYKTHELEAKAHGQVYKATAEAVKTSTAWQGVKQEVANNQSAVLATNYAELKVGVDRERYQVMGRTLFVELAQAKVDQSKVVLDLLQSAHDLIAHRRVRVLNGVPVDGADGVGAVPELQYEQLAAQLPPAPDFNSTIDLNEFMERFKAHQIAE